MKCLALDYYLLLKTNYHYIMHCFWLIVMSSTAPEVLCLLLLEVGLVNIYGSLILIGGLMRFNKNPKELQ
jgi:hypothetical protein